MSSFYSSSRFSIVENRGAIVIAGLGEVVQLEKYLIFFFYYGNAVSINGNAERKKSPIEDSNSR